jgi:peptidoglycan/xylan/chitin deacetylase (PgdA/CDA1 family)
MSTRIPILTYHSIDDSGSVLSTPPHKFRDQMQILQDRRFNIISLNNLINLIRNRQPFPSKTVVITFDDGFKNFYLKAYPILQEFGFSATVFLVPGYIGKTSKWNTTLRGMPVLDLLEWGQIKEMANKGIDFGAHSMTHEDLAKLSLEEARQEIIKSKSAIEEHINHDVTIFCYPYGITNREIKPVVQAEFHGACGTHMDSVSMHSDIYELPRIDMYYFSKNNYSKHIGTPLFSVYIIFRNILRSIKNINHAVGKLEKNHGKIDK